MTALPAQSAPDQELAGKPLRVMVVDDSAVVRGIIGKALQDDPDLDVASSVSNGQFAVSAVERSEFDVIILDIEMPVMDGLTALPLLLQAQPDVKVVVASTLTRRNAEISMRALAAGASDYLPKPTAAQDILHGGDFQRDLIEKVKALGKARRKKGPGAPVAPTSASSAPQPVMPAAPAKEFDLRPAPTRKPKVIAVGSSTGGPEALTNVLGTIGPAVDLPILVTQHMPPTFTAILAEHIAKASGRPSVEATDGTRIQSGHIYVAPGDYHMVVRNGGAEIGLNQDPPENFCRPAVDPMLRSMADIYGDEMLIIILTGMGHDGLQGGRYAIDKGASIVAQDETTSIVWGMPGAVATAGLCSAVLPVSHIGDHVIKLIKGGEA